MIYVVNNGEAYEDRETRFVHVPDELDCAHPEIGKVVAAGMSNCGWLICKVHEKHVCWGFANNPLMPWTEYILRGKFVAWFRHDGYSVRVLGLAPPHPISVIDTVQRAGGFDYLHLLPDRPYLPRPALEALTAGWRARIEKARARYALNLAECPVDKSAGAMIATCDEELRELTVIEAALVDGRLTGKLPG